MSSTDTATAGTSASDRQRLLEVARDSIEYGLHKRSAMPVNLSLFPKSLQQPRASFVTVLIDNRLRGCIGHLEATQAMVRDVADNAFAAAYQDPRFPPLTAEELPRIELHISLLSPAEPLPVTAEQELLDQLRPGVDGLILEDGYHRGTFLPSVWEQLPDPSLFIRHLKMKAGLPGDYWSDTIRFSRYTSESFP